MKYFIDTEFIEGFYKPSFGKKRHFIDLISIGIVCEDGREFHALSSEYKYYQADEWVRENVIKPSYINWVHGDARNRFSIVNFHKYFGKLNMQIANEIFQFVCPYEKASEYADCGGIDEGARGYLETNPPEFYGYYSDYDWVLFCSLFGRMIDLPKGFPMYCKDLKQMMDERGLNKEWKRKNCPDPENEHNALADAKWNYKLYQVMLNSEPNPQASVATGDDR